MKNIFIHLSLIFFALSCFAEESENLYPMQQNFQWGYIDNQGNWQIEPEFDWATNFYEDRAFVSDSSGRIFVIDKTGNIIFEYISNNWTMTTEYGVRLTSGPDRFHEGLVHKDDGVYYNRDGKEILDAGCEYCYSFGEFYDNRAFFEKKGKWGFVNKSGEIAISPEYDDAKHFQNGLAAVAKYIDKEKKWGFIDTSGKVVIPLKYNELENFSNGLAQFRTKSAPRGGGYYSLVGFINMQGDTVVSPKFKPFDIKEQFSEGMFPAELDDKYGYINTKGKYVINRKYDEAESFSEGLAFVEQESDNEDKQFFIDKKSVIAISNKLIDSANVVWPFKNGLAKVGFNLYGNDGYSSSGSGEYKIYSNTYYGYINQKGDIVKLQSQEEREYMRSVIDSIKNAEKMAEQRAEEREQNRINEKLKDCPDIIEYGDKNLPNKLIFNIKGKKRILYFDQAILERRTEGNSTEQYLYIPLFGLTKKDKERLKEKSGGGWFSGMFDSFYDDMSKIKLSLKPTINHKFEFEDKSIKYIDCLNDIPGEVYDEIWNKYNSKRTLDIKKQNDKQTVTFKAKSGKVESNFIEGEFTSIREVKTQFKDLKSPKISKLKKKKVNTEFVEFIEYYPNQNLIKYPGGGFKNYETLKLPDDNSDRFYKRSDSYLTIYKIITLNEDEIHIEEHEINLIENDKKWKNSIFLPPYSDNISVDKYTLNDSTLRKIIYSHNVIPLEMDFLIMKPDKVPGLLPKLSPAPEQQKYSDVNFDSELKLNDINNRKYVFKKISTYYTYETEEVSRHRKAEKASAEKPEKIKKVRTSNSFLMDIDNSNCEDCLNLTLSDDTGKLDIKMMKMQLKKNLSDDEYQRLMEFSEFASGIDNENVKDKESEIISEIKKLDLGVEIKEDFRGTLQSLQKRLAEITDNNEEALDIIVNLGKIEFAKTLVPFYKNEFYFNSTEDKKKKQQLLKEMESFVSQHTDLPEKSVGDSIDMNQVYQRERNDSEQDAKPNMEYVDIDLYQKLLSKQLTDKYSRKAQNFATSIVRSQLNQINVNTTEDFQPKSRAYKVKYKYRKPPVDVDIEYLDGKIRLTSETTTQGKDVKEINKPENIYDIYQLQTVIASLPLKTGFKDSLAFFDIYEEKTVSFSTEEGTDYMLRLKPMYLKANVEVLGKETIEIEDESMEGYKVKVLFKGDFSNHPMIKEYKSLFYDKESGQGYAYFYISEDGELLKMEKENDVFVPIAIMN